MVLKRLKIQRSDRQRPSSGRVPVTVLALVLGLVGGCSPDEPGDARWGKDSPAAPCVVCHSLQKNGPFRVAPNLWGIVGAPKARDRDWYSYSPGLIAAGGVWTREELVLFLADPSAFAPGSRMNFRVRDAEQRARIVDFLAELRD